MTFRRSRLFLLAALLMPFAGPVLAADGDDTVGAAAEMSKPVKVFILLGQSNMLGAGKIAGADQPGSLEHAVKTEGLYPFLIDDAGAWTERRDVRNVRVMASGLGAMRLFNNEWMTVQGRAIGPEIGIGHELGDALDEPVLVLKSSIGNRSLGWDLLPPGSESYEFEDEGKTYVYAGYKQSPLRWEKGAEPEPITWYAGMQYDGDVGNARKVLDELGAYYPGAEEYEVAGFFWWQGDKDRYNAGHASRYEKNLVRLIKTLREDFDAPDAKFVCATLGQTSKEDAQGNEKMILDAMFAISDAEKYPALAGDVATVYTHPLSQGGASNGHYNRDARTYMNVGLAMGRAMVELLED